MDHAILRSLLLSALLFFGSSGGVAGAVDGEVVFESPISDEPIWIAFKARGVHLSEGAHTQAGWDFFSGNQKQFWLGSGWKSSGRDHRSTWGAWLVRDRIFSFETDMQLDHDMVLMTKIDFNEAETGDESLALFVVPRKHLGELPPKAAAEWEGLSIGTLDRMKFYEGADITMDSGMPVIGKSYGEVWNRLKVPDPDEGRRLFTKVIQPLIQAKCIACHGQEGQKVKGGLDLSTLESALIGGDSGSSVLVPGMPEDSLLYQSITWHDEDLQMPPKENDRLSQGQIDAVRQWIAAGAPWVKSVSSEGEQLNPGEWKRIGDKIQIGTSGGQGRAWEERWYDTSDVWAFDPMRWTKAKADSNVDYWIEKRLKELGVQPAPQVDRKALLRRVSYSLTGLPPEAVLEKKYLGESVPWSDVVDSLLASPHYGERMTQHWLDVVRYADSNGFSRDAFRPEAHRYRTYAIESFNDDKPYDVFVREQIAGDELGLAGQEAMAFQWMGPWEHTTMSAARETRQQWLDDVVNSMGVTFMGQELRCAKCHDHKFDPISTRDYYSLQAVFASTHHHIKDGDFRIHPRKPVTLRILKGGSLDNPGDVVIPGWVSALGVLPQTSVPLTRDGRRAALAEWLTNPDHPLTARVMVNRVWQMHFGQGLVATPNNFGIVGSKPSHPELLDGLARAFVKEGWSIKQVHRWILNSKTFRRSTNHPQQSHVDEVDLERKSYAVFRPRRLTAEEIRDTMLSVTGELQTTLGGESNWPEIHDEVAFEPRLRMGYLAKPYEADAKPEERHRRSLYAVKIRGLLDPFMQAFNRPDGDLSCERRDETLVTPQVFTQLHGPFFNDRSVAMARRITESSGDQVMKIEMAFNSILGRNPSLEEIAASKSFLKQIRSLIADQKLEPSSPPKEVTLKSVKELTGEPIETRFKLQKLASFQPDLKPWDLSLNERALAQLCLMLFNTSEFSFVY